MMTTAKPTPAPWIEFSDQGKTVAILPAGRAGEVCSFATPYPSRANARLIAAAPDLLTALRELKSWVGGMAFTPQQAVDECDSLIAKAEAAIAKATDAC